MGGGRWAGRAGMRPDSGMHVPLSLHPPPPLFKRGGMVRSGVPVGKEPD